MVKRHRKTSPQDSTDIPDTLNAESVQRFTNLIDERYRIYLSRQAGDLWPWTQDPILSEYHFCNIFREDDKTTKWFTENIRGPMADDPKVLFATLLFRWFNLPSTGELFLQEDLFQKWSKKKALSLLNPIANEEGKLFTSAYMIVAEKGVPKHRSIIAQVDKFWKKRATYEDVMSRVGTMRQATMFLSQFTFLGDFLAYELCLDLMHTMYLQEAVDKDTWCYVGPGAKRGYKRLVNYSDAEGNEYTDMSIASNRQNNLLWLLDHVNANSIEELPALDMADLEGCLCEFDKYERCRTEPGSYSRRYHFDFSTIIDK